MKQETIIRFTIGIMIAIIIIIIINHHSKVNIAEKDLKTFRQIQQSRVNQLKTK